MKNKSKPRKKSAGKNPVFKTKKKKQKSKEKRVPLDVKKILENVESTGGVDNTLVKTESPLALPTGGKMKIKKKIASKKRKSSTGSIASADKAGKKKRKKILGLPKTVLNERGVVVYNVKSTTKHMTLHRIFNKYGKVTSLRIGHDVSTNKKKKAVGKSTVSAYVLFETAEMADAACEANGMEIEGIRLRVSKVGTNENDTTNRSVFVGNLQADTEEEKLRSHFTDCGEIESVRVIRDSRQAGKVYGYIIFVETDAVEDALQLDGKRFMGNQLRIQKVKEGKKQYSITQKAKQDGSASLDPAVA